MKPFQFILLRYLPDELTQEFANVGVVAYAPGEFLGARFNSRIKRLNGFFEAVDKQHFKPLVSGLERRINERGEELEDHACKELGEMVKTVLPQDNSALQWSEVRGGMTDNVEEELEKLFERLVCRYEPQQGDAHHRDDKAVWSSFRASLQQHGVIAFLAPKVIETPDYQYSFDHSWKNGVWNLYEPVSLDYEDSDRIIEKGNRWLGRGVALSESSEDHKLWFLIGEPNSESGVKAATKAMNLMTKIGKGRVEFVKETERESFSSELAGLVKVHAE